MRRSFITGFTLAEVLITLTIIGVIAALTIPSLITSIQDEQYKAAYKKAFSIASQVTLTARENQLFTSRTTIFEQAPTDYNFNVFRNQFPSVARVCYNNDNNKCWESTGELACTGACNGANGGYPNQDSFAFVDNSGMQWTMYSHSEDIIMVDTNGFKGPNQYGKDRWMLNFTNQYNTRITAGFPFKIMPYVNYDVNSVSTLLCHYPPCYYKSWLTQ